MHGQTKSSRIENPLLINTLDNNVPSFFENQRQTENVWEETIIQIERPLLLNSFVDNIQVLWKIKCRRKMYGH